MQGTALQYPDSHAVARTVAGMQGTALQYRTGKRQATGHGCKAQPCNTPTAMRWEQRHGCSGIKTGNKTTGIKTTEVQAKGDEGGRDGGCKKTGRLSFITTCPMSVSRLVKQSLQAGLDDTLLEHSLSDLHEAGDVSALHVVDGAVGLSTELHALLVDVLHDPVELLVNFLS